MNRYSLSGLRNTLRARTALPSRRFLTTALTAALTACGSDGPLAPAEALPDRLELSVEGSASLVSFGDSAVVRVRVLNGEGGELTGIPLQWSVSNPTAVETIGEGLFRARANGAVQVHVRVNPSATILRRAQYLASRLADSVMLTVQQQPARIVPVSVDSTFALLGATRTIGVQVADARGNQMRNGFTVLWQTDNPGVADVDSTGRVRTKANGTSLLSARAGQALWGTTIVVNANRLHTTCVRFVKRRTSQQQCVSNTVTMRAAP